MLTRQHVRVGLIGAAIQASASPAMHMEEARQQGLSLTYELLDLDTIPGGAAALERVLTEAERDGFAGVNITHPCKQTVMEYLHELSGDASALGAVNTVIFKGGRRIGHNTDWYGFAEGFRRELADVGIKDVVLVGAGGAGSAVAYAMLKMGVGRLSVFDTDEQKARQLTERLRAKSGDLRVEQVRSIEGRLERADGVINATPIGMAKYPGLPVPEGSLRPSLWVAEVVYFPLETALLRAARSRGCRTMDGGVMAVFQAVEAFRLFTGIAPDADRMLQWFRARIAA